MERPPVGRSRGLTLIELLVVVAVIATLATILTPAVQRARAAARRVACLNHLRHVGCGLHGHLLARRRFPIGCLEWRAGWQPGEARCLAWSAMILPWLDEQPIFARIDFERPFDHPVNAAAAAERVPLFLCPDADRSGGPAGMGRTDYGGLCGERISSPNAPEKGVLVHDRGFAEPEISDGLSRTILVAECARGPWADGQWINGRNLFDQAYAVNWPTWEDEIRSRHVGGAHALFGDGAVRLIDESVDMLVLAAACTRAGHEPLTIPGEKP